MMLTAHRGNRLRVELYCFLLLLYPFWLHFNLIDVESYWILRRNELVLRILSCSTNSVLALILHLNISSRLLNPRLRFLSPAQFRRIALSTVVIDSRLHRWSVLHLNFNVLSEHGLYVLNLFNRPLNDLMLSCIIPISIVILHFFKSLT